MTSAHQPSDLLGLLFPCPSFSTDRRSSSRDPPPGASRGVRRAAPENERRGEDKPNGATLESPRHSPRLLEPAVLERRRVRKAWNQAHARLRDAWTDPGERDRKSVV